MRRISWGISLIILTTTMFLTGGCSSGEKEAKHVDENNCSVQKAETGNTIEAKPNDDYTAMLDTLKPGDEIVFHEGTYIFPIKVKVSGTPDKPVIIRGYGKGEKRPVFLYQDNSSNLCEVTANNLDIAYLEFQPTQQDVNALRIRPEEGGTRSNITIENCVFRNCGGGSIDANIGGGVYDNIKILNNRFVGVKATPVYIGEHNGNAAVSNFVFEGNYIDASEIVRDDVVGYGIELKLNVKGGIIRNNLILNAKGPGIMVYGAKDGNPGDANLVEGNIVAGSRNSAGIEVGSGPSVVKNNIVAGCPGGGISVSNYGQRNLFENVTVTGNTAALNGNSDLYIEQGYKNTESLKVSDNLIIPTAGGTSVNIEQAYAKKADPDKELTELVNQLKSASPDLSQMNDAWSELLKGPFSVKQLKKILGYIV